MVSDRSSLSLRYFLAGAGLFIIWLAYGFITIIPGSIAPNAWVALVSLSGSICVLLPLIGRNRRRTTKDIILAIAVFGVFMGGVTCIRNLPESRFKQTYAAIRIGMTRAELEAVIRREFPDEMPPIHINETGGFIGPPPGGPNAEFIGVNMNDGRVTGKHYLPD